MPNLLNSGVPIKGSAGTSSVFITLAGAQISLGNTPTTSTGYTLVSQSNGLLAFTSTIGGVAFNSGIVSSQSTNTDLTLQSTGTGKLNLNGQVYINGQQFNVQQDVVQNLQVQNSAVFSNATNTVYIAGSLQVVKALEVDGALSTFGSVYMAPVDSNVTIAPSGIGTVDIRPSTLGAMDNVAIGTRVAASATFTTVQTTALNATSINASSIYVNGQPLGDAAAVMSDTPPIDPYVGKFWWDSTTGILRVYYFDGDSYYWIDATPNVPGPDGPMGPQGIQGPPGNIATITNSSLTITDGTTSTGIHSGALVVDGGVGIGGALYGTAIYSNGLPVLTSSALSNYGVSSVSVTTGLSISSATGAVIISSADTLDLVTRRGFTSTSLIQILSTVVSTSTNSGALTVTGGAGIGGDLWVNNSINLMATNGTGTYGTITYEGGSNTFILNGSLIPAPANSRGLGTVLDQWNSLYAKQIFEDENRVVTSMRPFPGPGIGIGYISTTGPYIAFTITNLGVTSIIGGPGVFADHSSGTVTLSNNSTFLDVTSRGSTTTFAIHISNSSSNALSVDGTINAGPINSNGFPVWTQLTLTDDSQLKNGAGYLTSATIGLYGVTAINAGVGIFVSAHTGSVTVTNIGVTSLKAGQGISLSTATGQVLITNIGVQGIIAGSDIVVSGNTGTITVNDVSTFQSVTNRGSTTTNIIFLTNVTTSTSYNTGALIVAGGVGIGGDVNIAGNLFSNGVYDISRRVLTSVTPLPGGGIDILNVTTSTGNTEFTVTNTGVLSVIGTTYLGVSSTTSNVVLTNLGVQSLANGKQYSTTIGYCKNLRRQQI